jgi:hypothetical protein
MTTEINVAARKCRVAECLKAVHTHTWFATASTLAVGLQDLMVVTRGGLCT